MSERQDGWTTSPNASSDLQGPNWGVSSSAKLLTRPSKHAANQSVTNFEQTLRPFDQTMNPFEQTKRPTQQTIRQSRHPSQQVKRSQPVQSTSKRPPESSQKPSRSSQTREHLGPRRPSRPIQLTEDKARRHSGPSYQRPSQRIPENPSNFGCSLGPSRPNQRPQEPDQPRRRSEQIPYQRVRNFKEVRNDGDAETTQPRRQSQNLDDRPSKPIPNHRSSSSPVQPRQSSQKSPTGFPHLERNRSDKSASSGSNSSTESYIELAPARRRELISQVNESVQTVMASMLSGNSNNVQWKAKLRKKDISYYMDETSVKPGQARFCCVSHTHATVEEVMKLFVLSDADSVVRNNRVLSDSLLEAKVLSVLRRPTKDRPMNSMYVRYSSYQAPGLMMNREVRIAVATDMIRQIDGSTIGYCLWDSVDDPEFVEATKRPGLELCTMFRSGYFFRRSGRRSSSSNSDSAQGYTKIVYMVGLETGGWASGLTARLLMERFGSNLTRLCSHFRRKSLDSRTFVMKTDWESKMSAKSCKECTKPFQVLSNRVNCHSCGQVVCRSCVSKELIDLHAVGVVPMHICFMCLDKAGVPVPASLQKTRSSLRRRRLQSDTATISRVTTEDQTQSLSQSQPQQYSKSIVESDLIEEEDDDDDTDTGEWAFTSSGVPIRPYRMVK